MYVVVAKEATKLATSEDQEIRIFFYPHFVTARIMPNSSTSSTSSVSESSSASNLEQKEKLLTLLKKEVKHIMEESVMLKTIHEDSSTVTSLCAVVDTCLSLGKNRVFFL